MLEGPTKLIDRMRHSSLAQLSKRHGALFLVFGAMRASNRRLSQP